MVCHFLKEKIKSLGNSDLKSEDLSGAHFRFRVWNRHVVEMRFTTKEKHIYPVFLHVQYKVCVYTEHVHRVCVCAWGLAASWTRTCWKPCWSSNTNNVSVHSRTAELRLNTDTRIYSTGVHTRQPRVHTGCTVTNRSQAQTLQH